MKKNPPQETQHPVSFFSKNAQLLSTARIDALPTDDFTEVDLTMDIPKIAEPVAPQPTMPISQPQNGDRIQLARANLVERKFKTLRSDILQPDHNANIGVYILNTDIIPKLKDEVFFNDMALRDARKSTLTPRRARSQTKKSGSKRGAREIEDEEEEGEDEEEDDEESRYAPLSAKIREHDPTVFDTVKNLISESQRARQNTSQQVALSSRRIIPLCSRAWNATMLKSPSGYDRPCVCGDNCIVFVKYGKKLKEFLTPEEVAEEVTVGRKQSTQQPCLPCIRELCHLDFEYDRTNERNFSPSYLKQPHRNSVDVPGEYLSTDCIPITSRYAFPMVMNKFKTGYVPRLDPATDELTLLESGYKTVTEQGFSHGASPQQTMTMTMTNKVTGGSANRAAAHHTPLSKRG